MTTPTPDESTSTNAARAGRIGRPPKLDAHGTPTRERLIQAAVEACVEFGYEGATLSDIARRADVSTPAVYSHFAGKAELLVEASQHELNRISMGELRSAPGLRELARRWLQPDFKNTRILVSELHSAAIRHPDVAALLASWQEQTAQMLHERAGLTLSQVKMFYLLLIGSTHVDEVSGVPVSQADTEAEMTALLEGWFGDRYR